ncbi:hypothetical protein DPMN_162864 [Dreissena polymorpha]|uniref:Uncharacterized protein n=1 Tax=Dreissena polymorpha TaxID=45954 RepID=A0A9D4ESH9_DREPO|nr:hypothetical protein DPMN_162864 [Dreissena polymorpha]
MVALIKPNPADTWGISKHLHEDQHLSNGAQVDRRHKEMAYMGDGTANCQYYFR